MEDAKQMKAWQITDKMLTDFAAFLSKTPLKTGVFTNEDIINIQGYMINNANEIKEKISSLLSEDTLILNFDQFKDFLNEIKEKSDQKSVSPSMYGIFHHKIADGSVSAKNMITMDYDKCKKRLLPIIRSCTNAGFGNEFSISINQSTATLFECLGRLLKANQFIVGKTSASFRTNDLKYLRGFAFRLGLGIVDHAPCSKGIVECNEMACREYSNLEITGNPKIQMPQYVEDLLSEAERNVLSKNGRVSSDDSKKYVDFIDAVRNKIDELESQQLLLTKGFL